MRKPNLTGASRFDFAISISIIAILATILLISLDFAQRRIEEITMEADLTFMRWEIRELWAHHNATGQSFIASEIENANPVRLLNDQLKNYSGEYSETPPNVKSTWFFDTKTKHLVYVFLDGSQKRYRLTGISQLNRASLGAMGGIDIVLDSYEQ